MLVFPQRPVNGYSEGHVWATSIYKSTANYETRASLLSSKLFKSTFKLDATGVREVGSLQSSIFTSYGDSPYIFVPLWFSATHLTQNATFGDTVISADTTDCEFGAICSILWHNNFTYEIFITSSYDASSVTLTSSLSGAFTTSDYIIPAYIGRPITPNQQLMFDFGHLAKGISIDVMEIKYDLS